MDAQQASARFPLLFPHIEASWHLAVQNQGDAASHNREFLVNLPHTDFASRPSRCIINYVNGFNTTEMFSITGRFIE